MSNSFRDALSKLVIDSKKDYLPSSINEFIRTSDPNYKSELDSFRWMEDKYKRLNEWFTNKIAVRLTWQIYLLIINEKLVSENECNEFISSEGHVFTTLNMATNLVSIIKKLMSKYYTQIDNLIYIEHTKKYYELCVSQELIGYYYSDKV